MNQYYVYILTNGVRTLYIGVTNDLTRRVYEHQHEMTNGYYEVTTDVQSAIAREKQLKGWRRSKKIGLQENRPD